MNVGPRFLGRVILARSTPTGYCYATLEPLIESDEAGVKWLGQTAERLVRFPTRGLVHWHNALPSVPEGSIWQFGVDEASGRSDHSESYQCVDPEEPLEVVDLRAWSDEMVLRSTISAEGVLLRPAPIARRILLWLPSGLCVGPLMLKMSTDQQRWILDGAEDSFDYARTPAWRIGEDGIQEVELDGSRRFIAPSMKLGQNAGIQNWSTDEEVAQSILRRLRKMDAGTVKALGVIDSVFEEYLKRLDSAGLIGPNIALERARADRLRVILAATESNKELVEQVRDLLLESTVVRHQLNQAVEAERQKLVEQAQAEIEAGLADRRAELMSLETAAAEQRRHLAQLEEDIQAKGHEIQERERELDEKIASFDLELSSRLDEIARRPEALFAQSAILRAALEFSRNPQGSDRPKQAHRAGQGSAEALPDGRPAIELPDEAALVGELTRRTRSDGVSPFAALALHSALAVGSTPVLIGERAYDLIRAYGSVAAGGRVHWVPVGSSLLEPHDLLGRFHPALQRIVPHAAGLLDVVLDAMATGRLHIVVLEGFNRAPIEGYLLPILESAGAARTGDNTRPIPIASPSMLNDNDPYHDASRITWPAEVLVTCIPSHGSATLPVPMDAWRFFTIVDAEGRGWPPLPTESRSMHETTLPSEISAELWRNLVLAPALGETLPSEATIERLASEWSLSASDTRTALSMRQVLLRNGWSQEQALQIAITSSLVPRTRANSRTIETSLSSLIIDSAWQPIHAEVDQLRD